jgi:UDP-N-acetylglucosamine 2-epimerase (non-hydrolysing)
MLDQLLQLFRIRVDRDLAVMRHGQTLASLTARLLEGIDEALASVDPAFALVQGDTTTVLAASLACFYRGVPVGHVEAGLRSGDLAAPFPEEANRLVVSRLAILHFAPTREARDNLLREGVPDEDVLVTGNTVIDALHTEVERQREPAVGAAICGSLAAILGNGWSQGRFVLVTGHRRESFGDGFAAICEAITDLARVFADVRFIYPVHLNPNVKRLVHERVAPIPNVSLVPPVGYPEFIALLQRSHLVLTDSGGVQEEASGLGKPVLVMRETTERTEGIAAGTVRLVGANSERIVAEVTRLLTDEDAHQAMARAINPYGDGSAAGRIVARIADHLSP